MLVGWDTELGELLEVVGAGWLASDKEDEA